MDNSYNLFHIEYGDIFKSNTNQELIQDLMCYSVSSFEFEKILLDVFKERIEYIKSPIHKALLIKQRFSQNKK